MAKKKKKRHITDIAEIRHHDGPLLLPEGMEDDDAIKLLMRRKEHYEQKVKFHEIIEGYPWDVARALMQALESKLGHATNTHTEVQGFFGTFKDSPAAIEIETDYGVRESVPAPGSTFEVPGVGEITFNITKKDGNMVGLIQSEIRRKDEPVLVGIVEEVRRIVSRESIYKGKAIRMDFSQGDMPQPKFMNLDAVDTSKLVYNQVIEDVIENSIMTPLRHRELCKDAGIKSKRGVLLAGPYGTGKTALALKIGQIATDHDTTFVYLEDVSDLPQALELAKMLQPAVVFGEDLDRIAEGERDEELDRLSIAIDGIDNKDAELMIVCTTNNLDNIHEVLRRHGRFDVTLPVDLPDSEAVERLIRAYGGALLDPDADFTQAAETLAGLPPATVEEVVQVAKLAHIRRTESVEFAINGEDMHQAAHEVSAQLRYSQRSDSRPKGKDELFGFELGRGMASGLKLLSRQEQNGRLMVGVPEGQAEEEETVEA